ncbi:Maf family protein [Congregibacter litoralis]|uniref:dTTP/UTP pyrophosphatase n=1 Tax=Congregibacter litoralis KT71 TaxID=314285 RepID=A4A5B5_9GAMM|nr:Maf family protein [Congregibacter litoralis]EAQ98986.1 MAF protein [Congregibacter litoralis KT71]
MSTPEPTLVLGSASPRRTELLQQLGLAFTVCPADIDETPFSDEAPRDYVERMAREKSAALDLKESTVLLTADTSVVLEEQSLGKPENKDHARAMLTALSGRSHEVLTAVCARDPARSEVIVVRTVVEFGELSGRLIDDYLATDEPWDKAGAYALQGLGGSFVRRVEGSVSNVIGLPLFELRELLQRFGLVPVLGKDAA